MFQKQNLRLAALEKMIYALEAARGSFPKSLIYSMKGNRVPCKVGVASSGSYPSGLSAVVVVVLGDAFVADAQPPGRVALVFDFVVVDAVVGQRFHRRQVTASIKSNEYANESPK